MLKSTKTNAEKKFISVIYSRRMSTKNSIASDQVEKQLWESIVYNHIGCLEKENGSFVSHREEEI